MGEKAGLFRIGTSGWSYPASGEGSWNGVFYPPGKVDELQYYAQRFDSWYDYNYSNEELKEWADEIKKLKADTFAYFNNDLYAYAPYNALELGKMLKGLSLVRDS